MECALRASFLEHKPRVTYLDRVCSLAKRFRGHYLLTILAPGGRVPTRQQGLPRPPCRMRQADPALYISQDTLAPQG